MFETLKAWLHSRGSAVRQAALDGEMREAVLSAARDMVKQLAEDFIPEPVLDTDRESGYQVLGQQGEVTEQSLSETRKVCRQLVRTNPTAKGIVRTFQRYVIGSGLTFTPVVRGTEDPEEIDAISSAASDVWRDFEKKSCLVAREKDMVKRAMTDGESILRRFRRPGGELALRFIEPETVVDTGNRFPLGIETEPDDVETVLNYHVRIGKNEASQPIPASEIIHLKHDVSVNELRGFPVLATPREMILRYGTWLRGRIILNNVRSCLALICYHQEAIPGDLAAFADAKASGTTQVPSYNQGQVTLQTTRRRRIMPGTVIDAPATEKYEMLTPNIQAGDAAQDGRSILLNVAACMGEAEYMLTGDASNADYASTMVSEAPAVLEFLGWRQELASPLETVWDWVMEHAQQSGLLLLPAGVTVGVIITGPRLVARDRLKDVQSDNVLSQARVLSRRTWASREELDFDEEQQRIEAEDEADIAAQDQEPEPTDDEEPPKGQPTEGNDLDQNAPNKADKPKKQGTKQA